MTVNVAYASTCFKYPTTTSINGEPTNKTVNRLKTKLGANGSSVDTDVGGGDHGYHGLLITNLEYLQIIPTPTRFEAPA